MWGHVINQAVSVSHTPRNPHDTPPRRQANSHHLAPDARGRAGARRMPSTTVGPHHRHANKIETGQTHASHHHHHHSHHHTTTTATTTQHHHQPPPPPPSSTNHHLHHHQQEPPQPPPSPNRVSHRKKKSKTETWPEKKGNRITGGAKLADER